MTDILDPLVELIERGWYTDDELRIALAQVRAVLDQHTVEQFGVRYGDSPRIDSYGTSRYLAEKEIARIEHNAKLPFVGQTSHGTLVHHTVTTVTHTSEWEEA